MHSWGRPLCACGWLCVQGKHACMQGRCHTGPAVTLHMLGWVSSSSCLAKGTVMIKYTDAKMI